MYDYLIIGSGLFGCVFAHEAKKRGCTVKIIEKRDHLGGNIYCENINNIPVHKYGAHIFHTNDEYIWNYVNSLVEFNRFTNSPLAFSKGRLYNLPFNMNTFYQLWGISTPDEARKKIEQQSELPANGLPTNLEEQAISLVGRDIFETLIKGYTEKQWGRPCSQLPAFIIKRIPIRFTFDNNYFKDRYQGIPVGGYNKLIEKLTENIEFELSTDFFEKKDYWISQANKIVYTGAIDRFFNYQFGHLQYRSLKFETTLLENTDNYQGNAVINFIDNNIPYTRIIEHKHFDFNTSNSTVITKEYPKEYEDGDEYYYPINDTMNNRIYSLYKKKSVEEKNIIFGGRLAEYKYYDMHQVIASALALIKKEFSSHEK